MAKARVKLELKKLNVLQVIALARQIVTALTGNPNFTTPNPTLTAVTALADVLEAALAAQKQAQLTAQQKTTLLENALAALVEVLTQLADYVNNIAKGDAAIAGTAGMALKKTSTPITSLDQVQNVAVTTGNDEGTLDVMWDSLANAGSFELEISQDPITATSWKHLDTIKPSKYEATGLTPGTRYWFRVRGIGSRKVKGPWSDPAVRMAL